MSFIEVINHVIGDITPSKLERDKSSLVASNVSMLLADSIKKLGVNAVVSVCGSYAKGTFLRGSYDIDFFIRFNTESDTVLLKDVVLGVFPMAATVKGSRDYFKVFFNGFNLEFIPVLLIDKPMLAVNSMDASFFHVDYVNSHINDALRNEVLLLKQFCRSCGVYGAESYIKGFSGYIVELLIIHFKGFINLLKFLDSNPVDFFIDDEHFFDSPAKAFGALKIDSSLTPVVIVDPMMPTRNAAAGLSRDSFNRFLLHARLFLRSPSKSFFALKPVSLESFTALSNERGHSLYTHKFTVAGNPDVFFSKLLKSLGKIADVLNREGFIVFDYGFIPDGTVFFELERDVLPVTKRVLGPPLYIDSPNLSLFLDKQAVHGPYVFEGRVCFDVNREHTRAKPLLMRLLRELKF
ncbi:MAG TPA: nucleotidyltransferase domain-containing protein [Candidatus Nanoarchaeia archaeon]|nr:nucleotidyltransferase domain-containing protein [Candidatus Nanoarchaeia archaeon]